MLRSFVTQFQRKKLIDLTDLALERLAVQLLRGRHLEQQPRPLRLRRLQCRGVRRRRGFELRLGPSSEFMD